MMNDQLVLNTNNNEQQEPLDLRIDSKKIKDVSCYTTTCQFANVIQNAPAPIYARIKRRQSINHKILPHESSGLSDPQNSVMKNWPANSIINFIETSWSRLPYHLISHKINFNTVSNSDKKTTNYNEFYNINNRKSIRIANTGGDDFDISCSTGYNSNPCSKNKSKPDQNESIHSPLSTTSITSQHERSNFKGQQIIISGNEKNLDYNNLLNKNTFEINHNQTTNNNIFLPNQNDVIPVLNNNDTQHPQKKLKGKSCKYCGKFYESTSAHSMHVRTHEMRCVCTVCGKRFSRTWLLQCHMRTHTGEKPFTCEVCNKAFTDKSNFRAHSQTHSGSKPFACYNCNKSFALRSYLYKHERSCVQNENIVLKT